MAEARKPDSRGLNFFDITDFSPGIYDNSLIAFGTPPNNAPGIFPAPPGAADVINTYGCMSMPNGGLGPLPARGGNPGQSGLSLVDMTISTGGSPADITALTNSFQTPAEELVIGVTDAISLGGDNQTTTFYSFIVDLGDLNQIETQDYGFTTGAKNFCAFPFMTIIDQSGTIQPVVVLPLNGTSGPNSNLMLYPDPAAPTVFGVSTVTQQPLGPAFGHQARIVVIQINNGYSWPIGVITAFPNEAFSYTEPPETQTWPHQFEIFGPENPFGYGAVSSVSAGELFCVKCRGGAIIIQGDLNNPTVTTLPGVKSTGILYGHSDTDQNGLYYCSDAQGAWAWNGGNTSQKISAQLDDNFFRCANPISDTSYYGYYCQRWGDWMLFSNNWVFNSTTGAWWRLDDPLIASYYWYVPGYEPRYMFCALPTVTSDSEPFLFEYDRDIPRNSFNWQSLPIKLPAEDRTADVRELVIRASNPYGDPAPLIIARLFDDSGGETDLGTWNMVAGIDTVQEVRLNARLSQTTTVAISLTVAGTDFAPVVHGLSVGYRTREHVGLN